MEENFESVPKKVVHKFKFTQKEDIQLIELVHKFGDSDWFLIASFMKNRNVRQCHERWKNYLSPYVSNAPWTPEEDMYLCSKVQEIGPKWTKIAPFFRARTDINVKNRWMTLMRKKQKNDEENPVAAPESLTTQVQDQNKLCIQATAQQEVNSQSQSTNQATWFNEQESYDKIDFPEQLDPFVYNAAEFDSFDYWLGENSFLVSMT